MRSPFQLRSLISLLLLLAAFSVTSAQEDYPEMKQWESFDFASKRISAADVARVTPENLELMRGVVFGKHGRIFKDWEIKSYLQSRDWYKPNPNFTNSALNDTERDNLDVIRIAEAEHHETVQPGDMRLYQNRLLTRRKLGTHTNAEWTVLAAEIEAIHGKRFDDQPWLQQYFEERYWYKAADKYKPSLSATEEKNLRLIDTIRRQQ
ncbi:MAG TPA: YARHG domain-containing protein, partial [Pyrinomonadaceae bacterium]|nr:YARHG domain-containing protein [Pyrinomonadaceae bacterium]